MTAESQKAKQLTNSIRKATWAVASLTFQTAWIPTETSYVTSSGILTEEKTICWSGSEKYMLFLLSIESENIIKGQH